MLIQIHLRIAKVGLKSHFRDSQVNMDQQIAEIDRKNVQSRVANFSHKFNELQGARMTTVVRHRNEQRVWENHALLAGGSLLAAGTLMAIAHSINKAILEGDAMDPITMAYIAGGATWIGSKCVERCVNDPKAPLYPIALLLGKANGCFAAYALFPVYGSLAACVGGAGIAGISAGLFAKTLAQQDNQRPIILHAKTIRNRRRAT